MEQQAFYIVFAIIGMAIVGIVSWAATYSSRNDYDDYYRHPGGYPPPYYPPYPPHYPQPQRESPIMTLLGLGLVVFLIFSMMQYCERVEERKRLQRIHDEDNNVVGVPPTVDSSNWGDSTNYEPPLTVPVTEYDVQPENERPPVSPHDGFYFQKSASHDDSAGTSEIKPPPRYGVLPPSSICARTIRSPSNRPPRQISTMALCAAI